MAPMLEWTETPFAALSPQALYEILQLRQAVFVVEQNCAYLDADGYDAPAWHLCGRDARGLAAYARLLPGGTKHAAPSIGRVITAARARGTGLGKALMREAVVRLQHHVGAVPIVLGAQAHLQRFYAEFGFVTVGVEYLEDGIPHIDMQRG